MMNLNIFKKTCLTTLVISICIPLISFAQESSDQTLSQQLTANSYSLEIPDSFSFQPVFVRPDETTQAQAVLNPATTTDLVKFTDLRGRSGGAFNVYAYMSELESSNIDNPQTIAVDNLGIATRSSSNDYSVDFNADNFLSPDLEAVDAPLDYSEALEDGQIPEEDYAFFTSTETGILIMDGTTNPGAPGRTGAYAVAPALIINIPENSYGEFSGTMTFELVLS